MINQPLQKKKKSKLIESIKVIDLSIGEQNRMEKMNCAFPKYSNHSIRELKASHGPCFRVGGSEKKFQKIMNVTFFKHTSHTNGLHYITMYVSSISWTKSSINLFFVYGQNIRARPPNQI